MNKDIKLTNGNDKLVVENNGDNQWFTVFALDGDDDITIRTPNVNVNLGKGNDRIANESGQPWAGVVYWDSPNAIQVDLLTGVAKDGWGTTDTLVNIQHVHTSGRNGDVVLGSNTNDSIWLNGFWQQGTSLIDGRAGNDTVTLNAPLSSYQVEVSADAREIKLTKNGYTATLLNIETLSLWDGQAQVSTNYQTIDLIDRAKVGPAVLLAVNPKSWASQPGQATTLTFSFMTAQPSYVATESGGIGFISPDDNYKQAVRTILQKLQSETGLTFTEVSDSASSYGQLRFGANQQLETKGYAYLPGSVSDDRQGDVWMDKDSLQRLLPGQEGWEALLHEIAHALGLSHPRLVSASNSGPVLLSEWNNNAHTVMSSVNASPGLWQSWYAPFDIQALQALYGASANSTPAQNNHYRLNNADGQFLQTLTDLGGTDTIDASGLSVGALLDLRPGKFIAAGLDITGVASWNNIFVGDSTLIERIYDTRFDDVIWGNALDNQIYWSAGNDVIDGQAGNDTVVVNGKRSQFDLAYSDYAQQFVLSDLQGQLGSVGLSNIEKVIFQDTVVTLGGASAKAISESTAGLPPAVFFDRTAPVLGNVGSATTYGRILPEQQLKITLNEPITQGTGQIKLTNLSTGATETFSAQKQNLLTVGSQISLVGSKALQINTSYKVELDNTAVTDLAGNPLAANAAQTIRVGNLDSLYQFFAVAFGAAPGGIYMDQLSEAYNAGLSVKTIVNIFTTKSQFTGTYPTSLSNGQLAEKLVTNIVKNSATTLNKNAAIKDITDALNYPLSVGDVIYNVFGNLANKSPTDPNWGGTALQLQKQTTVAKYLTEAMDYRTVDLPKLQSVLTNVTPQTDVSTTAAVVKLIGVALDTVTPL
jgi:hypothetical protein